MYKTINGWTKARMIEAINTRMLDHRAVNAGGGCVYKTDDGNRCAVGVFIPDEHLAEGWTGAVDSLLNTFSDLRKLMPLQYDALAFLQGLHDYAGNADPRPLLIDWINKNVEDGEAEGPKSDSESGQCSLQKGEST